MQHAKPHQFSCGFSGGEWDGKVVVKRYVRKYGASSGEAYFEYQLGDSVLRSRIAVLRHLGLAAATATARAKRQRAHGTRQDPADLRIRKNQKNTRLQNCGPAAPDSAPEHRLQHVHLSRQQLSTDHPPVRALYRCFSYPFLSSNQTSVQLAFSDPLPRLWSHHADGFDDSGKALV